MAFSTLALRAFSSFNENKFRSLVTEFRSIVIEEKGGENGGEVNTVAQEVMRC